MKLGVFTTLLSNLSLDEACKYFSSIGIEMVEIGAGGYPGNAHANPEILLNDAAKLQEFKDTIARHNLEISAFSCHANPLSPDKVMAAAHDKVIRDTILLCEKVGIKQINTFSGCPGDHEDAKYPNWVTCPWPNEYSEILEWQWNEKLIPYWTDMAKFAKEHGVDKIAFELHPGFCVYNTDTMLRIREAVGPEIGANLDPSHLVWQGMDVSTVIRALGDAIFHFHAKDTKIDPANTAKTGVLDTKSYGDEINRAWVFRSVGYGHDELWWKDIISNLRMVGYDYAISIEHEDSLMSQREGLEKAVATLKNVLITEKTGTAWWF
jgi:sugar phosphate isomerase/epimerase